MNKSFVAMLLFLAGILLFVSGIYSASSFGLGLSSGFIVIGLVAMLASYWLRRGAAQ